MNLSTWKDTLFKLGKEAGFSEIELYMESGDQFEATVFEGQVSKYSISQSSGLAFRGILNGKMGYAYTEVLSEAAIKQLVEDAKSGAEVMETEESVFLYDVQDAYSKLDLYEPAYEAVLAKEKLDFLFEVEKAALAMDERVYKVMYNLFGDSSERVEIANTLGLDCREKRNAAFAYVSVVVKSGDEQKTGGKFVFGTDFKTYDPQLIAGEAVEEALKQLGAQSIPSGDYTLLLRGKESANLLQCFAGAFSAENVHKNLSKLKGKLEHQVAAADITLVDNPHKTNGMASRGFDSEGVATQVKNVIDKGTLKTFLHNLKTAHVDGLVSTGNGVKSSFKSSVGIAPSNFYIEPGTETLEAMIASIEKGVYITGLQGLHSGANGITGEFSIQANGFLIEEGKVVKPVSQITIAGNYFEMLMQVDQIGEDLQFALPSGASSFGSPALRVTKIAVSGA